MSQSWTLSTLPILLLNLACPGVGRGGKGWEELGAEARERLGLGAPRRGTWGLEQGGHILRVNEPQDRVERPHPPEVDVTEVVAQLLNQPQALLIALHLGMDGDEARPDRGSQMQQLPTVPPTHHILLTP